MVVLLNSNLENSASNEISSGIAVKENKLPRKLMTYYIKPLFEKNLPTSRALRLTDKDKRDTGLLRAS